jgi:hypothetical protein
MSESIIEDEIMKHCPDCDSDLPLSKFGKYTRNKDGHNKKCFVCVKSYQNRIKREALEEKNKQNITIASKLIAIRNEIHLCEDYDKLVVLSTELSKLLELMKIEFKSVPENTIVLTYSQLFQRKDTKRTPKDNDFTLIFYIRKILSDNELVVENADDVNIIPFDEYCTFVITKDGFSMSEDKKRSITNSLVVPV